MVIRRTLLNAFYLLYDCSLVFWILCKFTRVIFEIFPARQAPEQKGIRYSGILIGKIGLVCAEDIFLKWRQ